MLYVYTIIHSTSLRVKLTLKNTTTPLFFTGIANILVCILVLVYQPEGRSGAWLAAAAYIEFCLFLVTSFIYLTRLLVFFREKIAIVAAFTMFACLLVINIGDMAFPLLLKASYQSSLGILTDVVCVLVAVRSFTVKAPAVSLHFKFFGAGIALASVPRLIVMLVDTTMSVEIISILDNIGFIVALLATCFILKRMVRFYKNSEYLQMATEEETAE